MNNNQDPQEKPKKQLKNAAILTGIAIQMGVTIYLFALLGKWLDREYNDGEKLFVIICTLTGIAISFYLVIKQVNRIKY
ncbi:putative F0F1-ATPase subunit (Ca2+/Mg2+ transporter) [Flavobacteriaceae bacterium MAR_2010_72]|nr:putative F0F1-ATPase subunit (Ca2+/Mg2+ transporter) [Flavobacteriaceae bacterium MAR_2010_72]TVZ58243.1 putative F0F1-ATPase subunit (Ca2+/Mg2+ transporter) [Flavobacteriaceae bacterium MAR_2010_105]